MGNKAMISLRQPDKILLVYGDNTVELKLNLFDYIFTVDKEDVHKFENYMKKGVKIETDTNG